MKLCLKILAIAVIAASTYSLIGCAAPASFSYQNVSISLTPSVTDGYNSGIVVYYNPAYPQPPNPGSVVYMFPGGGQGGYITYTATVTNAPATGITWSLYPQPNLGSINNPPTGTSYPVGESGSQVGVISAASGATAYYNAPSGPPIYSGAALIQAQAMGIPQGDILLVATVPNDPTNPASVTTVSQLMQMVTSPTPYLTPHTNLVPSGITAPAVTVARNATFQFYGGVVGAGICVSTTTCNALIPPSPVVNSANNTPLWEVCPAPIAIATCVLGGNSTLGTITQTGLYTAPAAIPSPLPVVLVTSQISPTITNASNYANVGIN